MRVLIIAFFYPPANAIGAVRAGKLSRFLLEHGHDVRVLSVRDAQLPRELPLEIPEESVIRTGWLDVNWLPRLFAGEKRAAGGVAPGDGLLPRAVQLYRSLFNLPDGQVGWLPAALSAGHRLMANWRPDFIYASARPFTGLIVASRLAAATGIPWVAEFRDLWADNPYDDLPAWRRSIDRWLERRTLATAAGLVSVSAPLVAELRRRHRQPVAEIRNGLDPRDYPSQPGMRPDGKLRIVHTGIIYAERRDPSPLFRALAALGQDAEDVRLVFYGRLQGNLLERARQHGVEHLVETPDPLSYRDSLAAQTGADILLLLLWNDPREEGVLTGKLFEYLGARRPILLVGYAGGEAGKLVRERNAGVALNDPAEIAAQLRRWLDEKRRTGRVAALPEAVGHGLTREDQFTALMKFLDTLPGINTRRA